MHRAVSFSNASRSLPCSSRQSLVKQPAVRAGLDALDAEAVGASIIQEWHQQNGNPAPDPQPQ
jgi:hypothetical protein